MKNLTYLFLAALVLTFSSCAVVGGIFKAGAITAIIGVIIVVGIIFWIISMFRGRS